jgi:hypothetical protein
MNNSLFLSQKYLPKIDTIFTKIHRRNEDKSDRAFARNHLTRPEAQLELPKIGVRLEFWPPPSSRCFRGAQIEFERAVEPNGGSTSKSPLTKDVQRGTDVVTSEIFPAKKIGQEFGDFNS